MSRANRLLDLLQALRRHRHPVSGHLLAQDLGISLRTLYRDIETLKAQGAHIEGEAGVGYVLRRGFDLPPLMFTDAEIEAMVLGARVVTSWGDAGLAKAAADALARVESVLPDRLKARLTGTPLFAPGFHVPQQVAASLTVVRGAIDARRKVRMAYTGADGAGTERTVRPLGLFFWGTTWSFAGWCELRTDFRSFRLDRIGHLNVLPERFQDEAGRTIDDYFARRDDHHME